jgi:hypothetical protein
MAFARIDFSCPPIPADLEDFDPTDANAASALVDRIAAAEKWIAEARPLLKVAYDNDLLYFTHAARFLRGPDCYDKV